jgi:ribonuclease J
MNTENNTNTNPSPNTDRGFSSNANSYPRVDNRRTNTPMRSQNQSNDRRDNRDSGHRGGNGNRQNLREERKVEIKPIEDGAVRIIPLGGVEEIGRNMTILETKNDIVVIDMGFAFSDEETPGVDYLLPNISYLEERKHKIRSVIVTHAHLDHIGGIPYLMGKLGNPPMYTLEFTSLLIQKRQEEFPGEEPLKIKLINKGDDLVFGDIKIKVFAVTHSIPDSVGLIIETKFGDIVYATDLRLDHEDNIPCAAEQEEFAQFKNRNVHTLLIDSTNVENPGFSMSNSKVLANIEKIISEATGRLVISMFASMVDRMLVIFQAAERSGKKVVVDGRSMKTNVEIIKLSGLFNINPGTMISVEDMYKYPENKLVILVTGSQGEVFGSLMRIANKSHKYIACTQNDTIVMSSSVIPGNEKGVQKLKDLLARQGVHIISNKVADIHSSGHANRDELAWIMKAVNPKHFIPIHGNHYMLRVNGKLAESMGIDKDNIVIPDNGSIIEVDPETGKLVKLKEKADSKAIYVDGFSVGNMQEVVLRDRGILASDGVFVTSIVIDARSRKLIKSPDIVSRGFVYLKESQELLRQVRLLIKKKVEEGGRYNEDSDELRNELNDTISKFFVKKTGKAPIVMSIIVYI